MGTDLMPYKAHSPKYQHFIIHVVSGSSLLVYRQMALPVIRTVVFFAQGF